MILLFWLVRLVLALSVIVISTAMGALFFMLAVVSVFFEGTGLENIEGFFCTLLVVAISARILAIPERRIGRTVAKKLGQVLSYRITVERGGSAP